MKKSTVIILTGFILILSISVNYITLDNYNDKNDIPIVNTLNPQLEKVDLYYNLDNPEVPLIKNEDGKYEEVVING